MRFLVKIKDTLDRLLEFLLIGIFFVLVAAVVWQVFTRYVPWMAPSDGTEEIATFLMIWVGLVGSSVALKRKAHLGIDYFVAQLPRRGRVGTELFGYVVVAIFSALVLVIGGGRVVLHVWNTGQQSPALEIPMWTVYGALPVSGCFLTLYSLVQVYETILRERGAGPNRREDDPVVPEA